MRLRALARHGVFPGDPILHFWPRYAADSLLGKVKNELRSMRDIAKGRFGGKCSRPVIRFPDQSLEDLASVRLG